MIDVDQEEECTQPVVYQTLLCDANQLMQMKINK